MSPAAPKTQDDHRRKGIGDVLVSEWLSVDTVRWIDHYANARGMNRAEAINFLVERGL